MKQFLFCLLLILSWINVKAQDHGLYWKYKDYDGAIALSVPRWVIHAGSWFVDEKSDRKLIRKVRKMRVLVFEEQDSPVTKGDVEKFTRKARRRHLESMLTIREQQTRVEVWAKERRNKLRKVVILVREPDTFALVSFRTKMHIDEIGQLLKDLSKDYKDKSDKPLLPGNVRSVIRI
jgi:hypothetical protein